MNPQVSPLKRLFGSRKFWVTFAAGVTSTGALLLPVLAAFFNWDVSHQQSFNAACTNIATAVGSLGGVLVLMIGAEDASEKFSMIPPAAAQQNINVQAAPSAPANPASAGEGK